MTVPMWRQRARALGGVLILVAIVGLSACSDDGGGSSNEANQDVFGAELPSDAEFATHPKALPADAFARDTGSRSASVAATPASFVIPESQLPPVQAQGTSTNFGYPGSCEVWSSGYAMGSYAANLTNQNDIKNVANTVSTAYVYMTVLAEEKKTCGNGTSASDTLDYLTSTTAPSLASIPYYPVCACPAGSDQCLEDITLDQSCASNSEFCTDLSIGSWSAFEHLPVAQILDMIKTWVATSHIVQISIVVPFDFKDYTSGVYDAPATCPSPQPDNCTVRNGIACIASTKEKSGCAQHGVAIVGYDDAQGALKIQNSFGSTWGEDGYIWMSYATFSDIYLGATIAFAPPASAATSAAAATPSAAADTGFQWVDRRDGGTPRTHLIFTTTLDRPLLLGSITITAPDGRKVKHLYGHWFRAGHHYVTRHDGKQFVAGAYAVRLEGTTRDGEDVVVDGTVDVGLAPGETLVPAPMGDDITGTNGQPVS